MEYKGINKWLFSTNHKEIGTLYIIFGGLSGVVGLIFSILIRMELSSPGNQILRKRMLNVLCASCGYILVPFCEKA